MLAANGLPFDRSSLWKVSSDSSKVQPEEPSALCSTSVSTMTGRTGMGRQRKSGDRASGNAQGSGVGREKGRRKYRLNTGAGRNGKYLPRAGTICDERGRRYFNLRSSSTGLRGHTPGISEVHDPSRGLHYCLPQMRRRLGMSSPKSTGSG